MGKFFANPPLARYIQAERKALKKMSRSIRREG
jgi:hypothetical protein